MSHPLAGTLPAQGALADIPALLNAYSERSPDPANPAQRVAFGTSGHRGTSMAGSFNEAHILAMTQAVCDIRAEDGITGPLFVGKDTHALSEPAMLTALEVLSANNVHIVVDADSPFTPTPVISHAILCHNRTGEGKADGIIITPSHNPPSDGGFKYNPPTGGPADSGITGRIEKRANELLAAKNNGVRRGKPNVHTRSLLGAYVADMSNVLDMQVIAGSGLRLGADPLGGATVHLWDRIAEHYKLNLTVVSREVDPAFRFVPLDHDGKTRMDCSSAFAMSGLLRLKDAYDLAFACDPDADRHGIVTPSGLMNPNHYLSVAVGHLFRNRLQWPGTAGVGKTVVTSAMLNRVAEELGRAVREVPVGFKWFVPYLFDASCGMGCEESAGASFLRKDGTPWSTDKDGPLLCLLAAEITAKAGENPASLYRKLTDRFGAPAYSRIDSPVEPEKRSRFAALTPASCTVTTLAGDAVVSVLTHAPANNAAIGGIKVSTEQGWFAARPSGTEPICKVYTESFQGEDHRRTLEAEAVELLDSMLQ